MAINSGGAEYRRFKKEIEVDNSVLSGAAEFYRSLFSRKDIDPDLEYAKNRTPGAYAKARQSGSLHEEIVESLRILAQSFARVYLDASREAIINDLNKTEKEYFRVLNRLRDKPVVTYRALTQHQVRRKREAEDVVLKSLRGANPTRPLPSSEFETQASAYLVSLGNLKDLTCQLADATADWAKYRDDRRRLFFAIAGVALTLFSLFVLKTIEIWMSWRRDVVAQHSDLHGCSIEVRAGGERIICNVQRGQGPARKL